MFRLGKLRRHARGPGMFFMIPCIDNYHKVDLRTVSLSVPSQDVSTTIGVDHAMIVLVQPRIEKVNKTYPKYTYISRPQKQQTHAIIGWLIFYSSSSYTRSLLKVLELHS